MYSGKKSVTVFLVQLVPVQLAAAVTRWDEKEEREKVQWALVLFYSVQLRLVHSCFTMHSLPLFLLSVLLSTYSTQLLVSCTFEKCLAELHHEMSISHFLSCAFCCVIFLLSVQSTRHRAERRRENSQERGREREREQMQMSSSGRVRFEQALEREWLFHCLACTKRRVIFFILIAFDHWKSSVSSRLQLSIHLSVSYRLRGCLCLFTFASDHTESN